MPENEIIAETHRHREEFARGCGFNVREMARRYRAQQARYAAAGQTVSFVHEAEETGSSLVREESPKP